MASGWASDDAVQEQIDSTVADGVERARAQLGSAEGTIYCLECAVEIPAARRQALPGAKYCLACQVELDKKFTVSSGYNRRGSKNSQLR